MEIFLLVVFLLTFDDKIASHINLYYTDEVNENHYILPSTCFYVKDGTFSETYEEIVRFCLSQLTSSYQIEKQQSFRKWTFDQLGKQNVTSEQLYFWSAPVDLIERYQYYLNQLSNQNELHLLSAKDAFYNCTLPRFGPQCQYAFMHDILSYRSFDESIIDYYQNVDKELFSQTCYTHLKCNRTLSFLCLDWREICDGKIDCIDSGLDEDHCWKLEINECSTNEFRCRNGQCIPKSFAHDHLDNPNCIDWSDEPSSPIDSPLQTCFYMYWPSFRCEEISIANFELLFHRSPERADLSIQRMYSNNDSSLSSNCSLAFQYFLEVRNKECLKHVQNVSCPNIIYFPNVPVVFGNIYFVYKIDDFTNWTNSYTPPFYICSNHSQYNPFFDEYPNIIINNMKCTNARLLFDSWMFSSYSIKDVHISIISGLYDILRKYHFYFNYNFDICNRSNMYQCKNSIKCISIDRLMDDQSDCPHDDDENATITSTIDYLRKNYFNCHTGKYISQSLINDRQCQCGYPSDDTIWCPDENHDITFLKTNIVFQHICDGFVDLMPIVIDGRIESDETECQQWQCNNIYTHCNEILNCLHGGADEVDCHQSIAMNCPTKWHRCVSQLTDELFCLPIERLGDGIIDCLGGTDEIDRCDMTKQYTLVKHIEKKHFYCMNFSIPTCASASIFCDGYAQCENGDDEQLCTKPISERNSRYCSNNRNNLSDAERWFCDSFPPMRSWKVINFRLHTKIENNIEKQLKTTFQQRITPTQHRYCHRGIDVDVWLDEQIKHTCFCPPSYYGDRCQYQSQRISLTIKFQALAASWRTPFAILISLIDDSDRRVIHSYEQITYLSSRDCHFRFQKYLIYSTQPKDPNRIYSLHIDFYEKISLKYRGSVLLPIQFQFLPVHRLSFIINIPRIYEDCSIDRCIHGNCTKYANQPSNITFCRCHSGWTGRYCHIPHVCNCSPDSLCIGLSADNRPICICPLNKFGLRCLITDTICQKPSNSTCQNGGQCIANHRHMNFFQSFSCICPKNFTGDRCEIPDTQLTITFEQDIRLPQSILFHFIEITDWYSTKKFTSRATTYQSIPFRQDSITIYWSEPFNLVFTELSDKNYYLTHVQDKYNRSVRIHRTLSLSDRCPNISEILFNQTILDFPLIRRIKYYHLPCQNRSLNLNCFYDQTHLCLCYDFHQQRLANCFTFDHQMEFDCSDQSECQNGGRCLQNKADCPTKSLCICPSCYFGQLCQFNTNSFRSSLDSILGYHILTNIHLMNQTPIVKMSFAFTIVFLIIGSIDAILCITTFKNKVVCEYACGLYLLFSSLTTLLITILFGLKYFILLRSQVNMSFNQRFFQIQCQLFDFLLEVCLSMNQWLNACVAVERTMMATQGAKFNRIRSVKAIKFVLMILFIAIIVSYVPDPIYRRVIEEENDFDATKRTWCIVNYSSSLRVYNYIIHIVHIAGPFLTNLISVIILLKVKARQKLAIYPNRTDTQVLMEQCREFKHLIIAPIALMTLTFPRLIALFMSKCMQSSNDAWFYLIGYFISFIPPILTFIIFVLPSKFYKVEFKNTIRHYRRTIQHRLNSHYHF